MRYQPQVFSLLNTVVDGLVIQSMMPLEIDLVVKESGGSPQTLLNLRSLMYQNRESKITNSKTLYHKNRLSDVSCFKHMYKVVGELFNRFSSPIPGTDNPSDLANEFG